MRVLVTGVKGQLGYDCLRILEERGFETIPIDKDELDITDKEKVYAFIENNKPNIIMHNAAWTAVDKAEECPDYVRRINVDGVKYIAEAAEKIGAKMVYISTDYVFPGDGENFYDITDKTSPINVYGKTKLEGEVVARACSKLFIIRISWVFGINGENFVKKMLKLGKTHKELTVVCDQIGSPTYTYDLSKLLCDMIVTNKYGTYHATNEGICSWAEFATEIFRQAKLDVIVHPVTTEVYFRERPLQAKRPLNSRLSKKSLDASGFNRLPSWQDALKRYLKELKVL